ncbi:MAG: PKD domain-containing protein [Bacteroidetes bacterium]|nr:PKD domain-containing protein [Bacteroidota bacterium]
MKRLYLLLLSLSFSALAMGQCMTFPVSLSERINQSDIIIEGKVVNKTSLWNATQDFIYTSNVIEVYKVFKGNITTNQIEIITEGGLVGNTFIKAEPALEFKIDETGIFFGVPSTQTNSLSPFSATLQFEGYAANQSFIKYDIKSQEAIDAFEVYSDISVQVYQSIITLTGQPFTEILPFNVAQPANSGPGGNPSLLAFPTITAITTPSTAGTFTLVTITGTNFGAGPFGGTRALEFRDANNGGAGFIPTPANHIILWSAVSIQAWVPTQAGSGTIRVTNELNESTISGISIIINYNESNVNSGGVYYQPDLVNDNGIGGYNYLYNNTFNANAPAVASFERALQTWRCNTFVNFNKTGTTAIACQASDGSNIVTFDGACALPAGVLGVSYSYYNGCASNVWYLTENDLKFRTNGTGGINWNYGPAPTGGGLFDFESVSLHELGHSHQLGHTIVPVTVMNYAVGPNTDRRTLTGISELAGGNDIMSRSIVNNSCGPSAMIALNASNCSINAPIANFSGSPTTGCNSISVTFTDLSVGTPTTWNWSFPGGAPAVFVGQNPPPILYAAPGSYTVTLVVSNVSGNDTEIKTNYIVVNNCPPPVANFSAAPLSVCTGQQVFFNDLSSNSPTGWAWTFPGGSPATSALQNPSISYAAAGVYAVTLTASNLYGSGSITKTAYITVVNCPLPPVAAFSGTPTTLCAGGNVTFSDLSTNSPNTWSWTFAGGTPATSILQNPVINYAVAGVYAVTLTVSNISGTNTTTIAGYITVNVCSAPVAAFTGWPTTVCAGSSVSFADQSTNSPTGWNWIFTGGAPFLSALQNPVVTYATAGVYNVSLQAINAFGNNSLVKTAYITVATCPAFGTGLIVNDGSLIQVETGALVTIQGGIINRDNGANIGRIDNNGQITLSGDWTNNSSGNAFINSSPGSTEFLGAAQFITGTTTTNFFDLILAGTGIKTQTLNTVCQGTLQLRDRELATQGFWMHVTNPSVGAVTRFGGLNSTPVQGFVSSTGAGRLRRNTNSPGQYLFPMGSSQGNPRFRPVALTPTNAAANTYAGRFVNNDPTADGFSILLKDANLGSINPLWYQKINGLSGTTNPDIRLYFDNLQDAIAPLPNLLMTQWAYNAPPVQWRSISGVLISGLASPNLSSVTKSAWISFNTENFNLAPQSIPLPVELINFTGACDKNDIIIKWSTASEINNDYFTLERSSDGINFEEVARLKGAGTTSALTEYSFVDNNSKSNSSWYYRLNQFDFNGESASSKIITVNCFANTSASALINIYPNPVNTELNIVINQNAQGKAVVRIVNVLGQIVYSKEYPVASGIQQLKIDLGYLAPDIYQVIVESGNERIVEKVVKQF